jgi:hypothetical protein
MVTHFSLAPFLLVSLIPVHPESPPPLPHSQANVNDSRSHGQVGDNYLSLNEAIQLYNQQLTTFQLSPAERSQVNYITGTPGTDVAFVHIDGSSVPLITIERDLDPILDLPHGLRIEGINDPPTLDFSGPGVSHGFRSAASLCGWKKLILSGGPYAVDQTETSPASVGPSGFDCVFDEVTFTGQSQFAIRKTLAGPADYSRLLVGGRCEFVNVPVGILIDERAAGWTTRFDIVQVEMLGVGSGIEVRLGSGGSARLTVSQVDVDATGVACAVVRPNGADRACSVDGTYLALHGASGLRIDGDVGRDTLLSLHLLDLRGMPAPGNALQLGPSGGRFFGYLEEVTIDGGIDLRTGGSTLPLVLWNARVRNGSVTLATTGGQPLEVLDTRFDNCQVTAVAGTVTATEWCLAGGSVAAQVPAAIQCTNCYLGGTVGAGVTSSAPRPAEQLGSFQVSPLVVRIAGPLVFRADLPPGLWGLFVLGLTDPFPTYQPQPLHVYMSLSAMATVPGLYRLQQSFTFAIPNNGILVGTDFTAQMAVLPDPGVQAPPLSLPPGRRFVLQQ